MHVWDPDALTGAPEIRSDEIVCVVCGSVYPIHSDTTHAPVWALSDGTEPMPGDFLGRLEGHTA